MATSFVPLHIFITMVLLLPDPIVTDNKTHNLANLLEKWLTVGGEEKIRTPHAFWVPEC